MKQNRAQIGVEFIMVIALFTVILIPTSILFFNYARGLNADMQVSAVNKLGNDIVDVSETLSYIGSPSSISIKVNMPDGINNLTFNSISDSPNYEVIFNITISGKSREMVFLSQVPLTGRFTKTELAPGDKKIRIMALNMSTGNVSVNIMDLDCSIDLDNDGYESSDCGGSDCNDTRADIYPGTPGCPW